MSYDMVANKFSLPKPKANNAININVNFQNEFILYKFVLKIGGGHSLSIKMFIPVFN